MKMRIIASTLAALTNDASEQKAIADLFDNVAVESSKGGMTLDLGNGPAVIAYGKTSLADEKTLRKALRNAIGDKVTLSRTNNVAVRCEQYKIARNATDYRKLFGSRKAETPETNAKAVETPETGDNPPADVPNA